MIDDLRLMIEETPLQSAIIDHRSKTTKGLEKF